MSRRRSAVVHWRVLSLNTWTAPERLLERTEAIAQGILAKDPAIVCLQEVCSSAAKALLRKQLSPRYHIVGTDHWDISFPALAWGPAVLFALLVGFACSASGGLRHTTAVLLTAGGVALSPPAIYLVLRHILVRQRGDPVTFDGLFPKIDMMGQVVLVRKASKGRKDSLGWDSAEIVSVKPFPADLRGYPKPLSVRQWPGYWIQHCLLRPGCFIVRCRSSKPHEEALVASAHLVVSKPSTSVNARRIQQVQYLNAAVAAALDHGDSAAAGGGTGVRGEMQLAGVVCQ